MEESQAGGVQIGGQHIKGVYEDQMPLDFAAVLALGCVATVCTSARSRPLAEGFQLHELQVLHAGDDHDSGFTVQGEDVGLKDRGGRGHELQVLLAVDDPPPPHLVKGMNLKIPPPYQGIKGILSRHGR